MNRKEAREEAFKLVFAIDIQKEEIRDRVGEFKNELVENDKLDANGQVAYVEDVVFGVLNHCAEIDNKIKACLKDGWGIERITKVALAALRVCTYEIVFTDIPEKASINEAIDLVKKYDVPEVAMFVNGILGNILADFKRTI